MTSKALGLLALIALTGACANFERGPRTMTALGVALAPTDGLAQRGPDLIKPAGKEWLTIGGDFTKTGGIAQQGFARYSTVPVDTTAPTVTKAPTMVVSKGVTLGTAVVAGAGC